MGEVKRGASRRNRERARMVAAEALHTRKLHRRASVVVPQPPLINIHAVILAPYLCQLSFIDPLPSFLHVCPKSSSHRSRFCNLTTAHATALLLSSLPPQPLAQVQHVPCPPLSSSPPRRHRWSLSVHAALWGFSSLWRSASWPVSSCSLRLFAFFVPLTLL